MSKGAWIFLSHSNKDFDRVRELRNGLEAQGHRPLMFFLKALDEHDEIFELIEREIEARSWFILCESENARKSEWVRREMEIIKTLPTDTHTYKAICIDDEGVDLLSEAASLTRRATVFLSYAHADHEAAERIRRELLSNDFGVWDDRELAASEDFQSRIEERLNEAVTQGAVLILLSLSSVRSTWVHGEIRRALDVSSRLQRSGHILVVFLQEPSLLVGELPPELTGAMDRLQSFVLDPSDQQTGIQDLLKRLRAYRWDTPGTT